MMTSVQENDASKCRPAAVHEEYVYSKGAKDFAYEELQCEFEEGAENFHNKFHIAPVMVGTSQI